MESARGFFFRFQDVNLYERNLRIGAFLLNSAYLIAAGGACGALARIGMLKAIPNVILCTPSALLAVNCLGCFLAGVFAETSLGFQESFRPFF